MRRQAVQGNAREADEAVPRPACGFEAYHEALWRLPGGTHVVFVQRTSYTKYAVLIVPKAHRSTLEPSDLAVFSRWLARHPNRIVSFSGLGSGATQAHIHGQSHLRAALGDTLPIENARRRQLVVLEREGLVVSRLADYALPGLWVTSATPDRLLLSMRAICQMVGELHAPCNIICAGASDFILVGRSNEVAPIWPGKRLGALEIAGVLVQGASEPIPCEADFLTALRAVGLTAAQHSGWEARILQRFTKR